MRVPTIKWSNVLIDSTLEPSIGNRWNWWRWAMHSYPDTPLMLLEQALPVWSGWKGTTEAACHTSFWHCSTLPILHPRWAALPVSQLPCRNSPVPPETLWTWWTQTSETVSMSGLSCARYLVTVTKVWPAKHRSTWTLKTLHEKCLRNKFRQIYITCSCPWRV